MKAHIENGNLSLEKRGRMVCVADTGELAIYCRGKHGTCKGCHFWVAESDYSEDKGE
jgi:hypothetical protein